MSIDDCAKCCARFKQTFPGCEPPAWDDLRELELVKVMAAITRVKGNPLTKFNNPSLVAGLVLRAARAKFKRSRLVK